MKLGEPASVDEVPNAPKARIARVNGSKTMIPFAGAVAPASRIVQIKEAASESVVDEFGLTPPTPAQLFCVQSEESLKDRLRQELPNIKNIAFPAGSTRPVASAATGSEPFPQQTIAPVSCQVCYRPLYLEDKATERFGSYVPCVQPLLSAGRFYCAAVMLPYRLWQAPPWTFECDNR